MALLMLCPVMMNRSWLFRVFLRRHLQCLIHCELRLLQTHRSPSCVPSLLLELVVMGGLKLMVCCYSEDFFILDASSMWPHLLADAHDGSHEGAEKIRNRWRASFL
jgi:hypothetical protein